MQLYSIQRWLNLPQSYAGVKSLISTFRALVLPLECARFSGEHTHTHFLKSIPFLAS